MRIDTNNVPMTTTPQREPSSQLGKDEFLKILITQLRNQDPLNPMEDRDFISQMAQFSSLEQMQNLSRDFSAMKGMNMIGRMVFAEKHIEGTSLIQPILGRVEQITFIAGVPHLRVSGYDLTVDEILQVLSESEAARIEKELAGESGNPSGGNEELPGGDEEVV